MNALFSIKGDRLIKTHLEAIRCFFDTGLDALIMGDYLLDK